MSLAARDREIERLQRELEDMIIDLPEEEPALTNIISELGFIRFRLEQKQRERQNNIKSPRGME